MKLSLWNNLLTSILLFYGLTTANNTSGAQSSRTILTTAVAKIGSAVTVTNSSPLDRSSAPLISGGASRLASSTSHNTKPTKAITHKVSSTAEPSLNSTFNESRRGPAHYQRDLGNVEPMPMIQSGQNNRAFPSLSTLNSTFNESRRGLPYYQRDLGNVEPIPMIQSGQNNRAFPSLSTLNSTFNESRRGLPYYQSVGDESLPPSYISTISNDIPPATLPANSSGVMSFPDVNTIGIFNQYDKEIRILKFSTVFNKLKGDFTIKNQIYPTSFVDEEIMATSLSIGDKNPIWRSFLYEKPSSSGLMNEIIFSTIQNVYAPGIGYLTYVKP